MVEQLAMARVAELSEVARVAEAQWKVRVAESLSSEKSMAEAMLVAAKRAAERLGMRLKVAAVREALVAAVDIPLVHMAVSVGVVERAVVARVAVATVVAYVTMVLWEVARVAVAAQKAPRVMQEAGRRWSGGKGREVERATLRAAKMATMSVEPTQKVLQ